ncbi:polysaccharide biosynthesis protein [Alloiococcus sp. CFN-8]|uniref:polysaccharide biosynthesis protein n=1 Tax=Alloiococcus sp. CFN-8 TaxID=3416081 RepID=UPI003CF1AFD0
MRLQRVRKLILALCDIFVINLSFILALVFRFGFNVPGELIELYKMFVIPITLIYVLFFKLFNLYNSLWSYAGIDEVITIATANVLCNLIILGINIILPDYLPYSVIIFSGILITMFTMAFRLAFRFYRQFTILKNKVDKVDFKRVLIVGAGYAGINLLKDIERNPHYCYQPIGFIDDNPFKKNKLISGIKVLGCSDDIKAITDMYEIDLIILAIPSLGEELRGKLLKICSETGCEVKTMPGVWELLKDRSYINQVRGINLKDILGREPVKLDNEGIEEYITNQRVMVTGGGGSIGSELCRQIISFKPRELIILDIYENNAYNLQNELLRKHPGLNLTVLIASVRDRKRLEKIFEEYRPSVVFHAAAHKHVPLMETSPGEAIKNNVMGTLNTAECADKYGVNRFVLISTDKAVNPTNVMGASKRICEMIIQSINTKSRTEFVAVRFGNVLGSNGSVIPLFENQIQEGGPVTVTHKDITRYFMLIPEAAQLVLQAGAYAKGGEIFVLDMGSPVRIYDMAEDIIRLSGYEPHKDIKIQVTGLRPGEKLYEELLMDEEGLKNTDHEKIFIGKPGEFDFHEVKRQINELLDVVAFGTKEQIKDKVAEVVPTYYREDRDNYSAVEENYSLKEITDKKSYLLNRM